MTHRATAFAIAHPGGSSASIGPRTMAHLDDLLAGAEITPDGEILDQIDEIISPEPISEHSTWLNIDALPAEFVGPAATSTGPGALGATHATRF